MKNKNKILGQIGLIVSRSRIFRFVELVKPNQIDSVPIRPTFL